MSSCLTETETIFARSILAVDTCFYFIYYKYYSNKWVSLSTTILVFSNICLIILISFAIFTGVDFEFSPAIFLVCFITLFVIWKLLKDIERLIRLFGTSVLIIATPLAANYIPSVLQQRFGISEYESNLIAVIFPLTGLFILEAIIYNPLTRQVIECILLSAFFTLTIVVIKLLRPGTISLYEDICCDLSDVCPLWFNYWEFMLFALLVLIISLRVVFVLFKQAYIYMKNRRCCCNCCCKRCQPITETKYEIALNDIQIEEKQKLISEEITPKSPLPKPNKIA